MTPKEQYEARKAERKLRREQAGYRADDRDAREHEFHEMFDRFVTAAERIAAALERKPE
jgi:hypothetical protein